MRLSGQSNFDHRRSEKTGILITNLGTPERPDKKSLRKYLKEFLSDHRVVEIPKAIWWFILNGIILNTRPKASAKLYQTVWTEKGSPLFFHTQAQCEALKQLIETEWLNNQSISDAPILVDFAMRYGKPSIGETIQSMQDKGVSRLLVLPLYPQYASSTSGSTFDAVADQLRKMRWVPELRFTNHYCDHARYIQACAEAIQKHWQQHPRADKLVFSFHGLPKFSLDKGDPYYCQCQKTARLIGETLDLNSDEYVTTFQSRFGRAEWLQPYTDKTLMALPGSGVKSVDIFCPGFSADCLETLEEIAIQNKQFFIDAGGQDYRYIPALNASPAHIHALIALIENKIADWLEDADLSQRSVEKDNNRQQRFIVATEKYPETLY